MEKTIEEQIRDSETIPEDKLEIEGTVEDVEYMRPLEVLGPGKVYIYDTRTGEPSICSRNMLAHNLRKKRPDGSIVFTTVMPKVKPKRGEYKCMLHADYPGRHKWEHLGLPYCKKSNLLNPFQVRRHMQKRHKMEWEAIQEEERREKEERQQKLQEAMIKSAGKK
jgi:hypothetical protein